MDDQETNGVDLDLLLPKVWDDEELEKNVTNGVGGLKAVAKYLEARRVPTTVEDKISQSNR